MDILCSQDFKTKYLWHHRISGTVSLYIGKPILIWIRISDLIESWKSCQENYYLIRSSQLTIFIFDDNSPTSHKWNICRQEKASKRKFMLFLSTQLAGPVFATTSVCEYLSLSESSFFYATMHQNICAAVTFHFRHHCRTSSSPNIATTRKARHSRNKQTNKGCILTFQIIRRYV